jgi:hypothetical protein
MWKKKMLVIVWFVWCFGLWWWRIMVVGCEES